MNQLNALCRLVMAEKEAQHFLNIVKLTREQLSKAFLDGHGALPHLQAFMNEDLRVSSGRIINHVDKANVEFGEWIAERRAGLPGEPG